METSNRLRCISNSNSKNKAPIPKRRTSNEYGSSFPSTAFVDTKETPQKLIDIVAYNDAVNFDLLYVKAEHSFQQKDGYFHPMLVLKEDAKWRKEVLYYY